MHKHLVLLFIFFNAFVSFSQTAISTRTLRVASATAVFNQNIPIGTLVLDIAENKLFVAKASVASIETLTTATASFELNYRRNPISQSSSRCYGYNHFNHK